MALNVAAQLLVCCLPGYILQVSKFIMSVLYSYVYISVNISYYIYLTHSSRFCSRLLVLLVTVSCRFAESVVADATFDCDRADSIAVEECQ